jgi:sec-independent protein translocase protein TatA
MIARSGFTVPNPGIRCPIMAISPAILAAFGFGGMELLVILLIVLVLFGGAKLPSLAKGLGQSIKEFKKASKDDDETKAAADAEAKKPEATKTPGAN